MGIRTSIGRGVPVVPFELEWALRCCNNDLVYGQKNCQPEAMLKEAERWERKGADELAHGNERKANVYFRHSQRYLEAAAQVEKHDKRKGL